MNVYHYVTSGLLTIDRAALVWNLGAVVVLVDDKRAGRAGTASPLAGSPADSIGMPSRAELLAVGSVHHDW